jgi:alpha-glucuronidase
MDFEKFGAEKVRMNTVRTKPICSRGEYMMWEQLWLNYRLNEQYGDREYLKRISVSEQGQMICNAVEELSRAIEKCCGITPKIQKEDGCQKCLALKIVSDDQLGAEGYHLYQEDQQIRICGASERGILYGVFDIIRRICLGEPISGIEKTAVPSNPLRMLNHWDNMSGDIERGYSGNSFFFQDNQILVGERTRDYARLMSSVGINAAVINNVNVRGAACRLITEPYLEELQQMSEILEGYGIRLFLSIDFAAPIDVGGLETADPLDGTVEQWWRETVDHIYEKIPAFGGFLIKADSEGRPGPFTYGRTHADGANMFARLLAPHHGLVVWRCFVYNCRQDWRDYKTDRAKAAYDNFMPLDGQFEDNVILQIKNGPVDFQVREPVSPLFGGLQHTNQMLEVQIAQEYTGHQIDVCYLIPMWKEVLEFHTHIASQQDTVDEIVSGKTYGNRNCGIAAVSNTGNDLNWTGNDLAAANLYGFGRLAFDTTLSAQEIAEEWCGLTFGVQPTIRKTVTEILMASWPAYENYTSPLGVGWMVRPGLHYGPSVDGYEYDVWGTYHRADHLGIGVERSARGTGYAQQYHEPNASMYDSLESCPDELLLFFHHVPYLHRLNSGKTVIQHIYDTHFEGVEMVEDMIQKWNSIQPLLNPVVYQRVAERFERQLQNARNWRDVVNTYFHRKSMIEDEQNRKIY